VVTKSIDGSPVTPVAWSASLRGLADQFGSVPAVVDGQEREVSYVQLCERAHRLAHRLLGSYDVGAGQPVALLLPNQACAVVASYGVRVSGAAEVLISYKSTAEEIQWCMSLSKATHVITLEAKSEELQALGFEAIVIDANGEICEAAATKNSLAPLPAVDGCLPGRVLFTSGTTGKPKGVLYSHERRWVAEQVLKASLPFTPQRGDKIILMTPFIHGSSLLTYAWCDYGAQVVLLEGVEQQALARLLPDTRVVAIFAPPTVLAKLGALFEGQSFPHVRCVFTGTQPLTGAIYERAIAMFGPTVRITYGKSECVNPITVLTPEQTNAFFHETPRPAGACVGYPASGVEIKIVAGDDTDEGGETDDGEVWLRAAHMSLGFLMPDGFRPHEPDGWHQTGDLGHIDDRGRLVLTGRLADVIKTGGYRVNPDEIEACLSTQVTAVDFCVTSIPSDYWGEVIIAVAARTDRPWQAQAQAAVESLSRHKHPRVYVHIDSLPRNPQGKVSRRQVRQQVLASYRLLDGQHPRLEPLDPANQ